MNELWRYLHENEAYEEYKKWQFFILMKGICTRNYKGFCVAVNKSYVPFTRKFPMVMHFGTHSSQVLQIIKNNFYVSNYD